MKNRSKVRSRDRVMRVLTLICFFHFTGLNNGFAYIVVSSGKMQRIDFAPFLVERCANVLNPANWKRLIFDPLRLRLLDRPTRVVGYASQRAIQNLLDESDLFQIWFNDARLKIQRSIQIEFGEDIEISESDAMKVTPQGQLHVVPERSRIEFKSEVLLKGLETRSLLSESAKQFGLRDPPGYLKTNRRNAWLKDRLHLWKGDRIRDGPYTGLLRPNGLRSLEKGQLLPTDLKRAKKFVKFTPDKLRARLIFVSESSEDDSTHLINGIVQELKSPRQNGVIFFLGSRI